MLSNQGKAGSDMNRENNGEIDSCVTSATIDKIKDRDKERENGELASKASKTSTAQGLYGSDPSNVAE
jgi:hypothetical protein